VLLATLHPVLILLLIFAMPPLLIAMWRPRIEREIEESVTSRNRLARHLFVLGTTAPAGKEVRLVGSGPRLVEQRRRTWDEWYVPVAASRWTTALWHAAAWTLFAARLRRCDRVRRLRPRPRRR
jgi:ATP-binding cassette subfamily B protein